MSKSFFDTNILLYHIDNRDLKKHIVSLELFNENVKKRQAVISTQVLQEFYATATVKFHVDYVVVKQLIRQFENLEVITIGRELIYEAIDASVQNKISFWDSLIVVAAESANCDLLYTEDMNHGQVIRNVKVANPFKQR